MRTIKFRGKMNADDWWYVTPDDEEWEHFWALVDRETVGQFTGWRDHKKNEVYEGDIVQFIDGHRGVVAWDTINDGWRIHIRKSCLLRDNEMIVIGNIYETPELLKEQA